MPGRHKPIIHRVASFAFKAANRALPRRFLKNGKHKEGH